MDGSREAMSFPGSSHPPFYFPTSIPRSSPLHAPPGFRPLMSNPNSQQQYLHFVEEQRQQQQQQQQDYTHGVHMGMSSSPTIQQPPTMEPEPLVKKKRGRPRKYVPENEECDLALSPIPSSHKAKTLSSSVSDNNNPNEPKRARGRPPGTGRKQRLANLGEWMNTSAGFAFAPHVISVEPGEDIVSKLLSFSQQRPRVLCIMSGTGTVSSVTLRQPASSTPSLSFQGHYEILSLGGSYLVNEEGGSKSRIGGISVSLSRPDGYMIGGGVGTLIAASLVQVVACSFVYGSAKAKAIKQENVSKEDENKETPSREPSPTPVTEAVVKEEEEGQTPPDLSSPNMTRGWSDSGGVGSSRNLNDEADIDLTCG